MKNLGIANQVKRQSKYKPEVMSFERILTRTRTAHLANEVLASHSQSLEDFKRAMGKHDVKIEEAVNRKGNAYGLRFTGYDQTFKGSQISKEFGYGTLLKTFSENRKAASENLNSEIAHKQSQSKSIKGELLSGIGAVITAGLSGRGYQLRETKEERRRRRNMNKNLAGNAIPRTQSVKDAKMAEIIVTELSKFTISHELIMESIEKILSRYNGNGMLIERMDKRDQSIGRIIKDFRLSTERYAYLTKMSMSIAQKLKEIDEHGIRMEAESLNKIIKAVEKGNEPMGKQIRWITYGTTAAFGILLLLILF